MTEPNPIAGQIYGLSGDLLANPSSNLRAMDRVFLQMAQERIQAALNSEAKS